MNFILYRSMSPHAQDMEVVLRILRSAVAFNDCNDLTGFLLTRPGGFLQFIEGPQNALRDCYARIAADPLHYDLTILASGVAQQRHFPKWRMGLVSDAMRVRDRAREWSGCVALDDAPASVLVAAMAAEAHGASDPSASQDR